MVSERRRFDLCHDLRVDSPEVASAANGSDGGADRGDSLGLHRHAGEGERLDGSTNEEESNREGMNVPLHPLATRGHECVDVKTRRTEAMQPNLTFLIRKTKGGEISCCFLGVFFRLMLSSLRSATLSSS